MAGERESWKSNSKLEEDLKKDVATNMQWVGDSRLYEKELLHL